MPQETPPPCGSASAALAIALGATACPQPSNGGNGNGAAGNGDGAGNGAAGNGDGGSMTTRISVTVGTASVTPTGFTLTLMPGVPGLTPADFAFTPPVTISKATATDTSNTSYAVATVVTEAFTAGQEYTLAITKAGYAIANASFTMPVFVAASVTGLVEAGFTLTLMPGVVPGLTPADFAFTPPVAISKVHAAGAGASNNTRYTVATEAFASGQEYTLAITKAGYNIQDASFTFTGEARITKMTLTVHGVEVEGTITDSADEKTIRFPGGARSHAGPTLTGVVSLALSEGAQVAGTNPHDTVQTYSGSAQTITVQTGDAATKQAYSVAAAAYDEGKNPYGVYTPAQLHAVRGGLAVSYRLMQSLTLPAVGCSTTPTGFQPDYCSAGFQPIGTNDSATSRFTGKFDGNGHTINNLAIARGATRHVGLFGVLGASSAVRHLGVNMAATGVQGSDFVGGLVGRIQVGSVANCYVSGAVFGSGSHVGGLVGGMAVGTVAKNYATGVVFGGGSEVGGLVGNKTSGTVVDSYYPLGRPAGTAGTALNSGAKQSHFANFGFDSMNADWEWVADAWPQLTGFQQAQKTPNRTFHTATVSAPSTAGFTIALAPALGGSTRGAWALYEGTPRTSTPLLHVVQRSSGSSYTFTASLVTGKNYQLVYMKPDVIVMPAALDATTLAVVAPTQNEVTTMTLSVHGVVLPGKIAGRRIVFPYAPRGNALTGTVAIGLTSGATRADVSLNDSTQTYAGSDAANNFQLRVAGDSTPKTYTVTTAPYHASQNPYGVYTAAQLHDVRSGLTASYLLMQDVTLPDAATGCTRPDGFQLDYCSAGFQPIGTPNASFTGTFDGNGNSIRNFSVQRRTMDFVGLFGHISASAKIRNLGVNMAAAGVKGRRLVGGLVGYMLGGTVSDSYYPSRRPAGVSVGGTGGTGAPLSTEARQADFAGFVFTGAHGPWEWAVGSWPRLTGMETVQVTPSLSYRTATVAATPAPSTGGFALTLAPPLSGRAAARNWALYAVTPSSSTVVAFSSSAAVSNGGARYAFTATLAAGRRYQLIYTQPDVIVVPSASAGHITFTLP